MKKAKIAPSIAAPPTPTPTPTPTSTPELEEEAPVEAAPAEGATPDEDPAKLVVLTAASVRDDVPEPVELGFANVWRWPMMVLVYGSPAKLRTSFPEPQLQPSLQQYESPEAVPLQLKTGFPRFEAVDQKRVSYQSFHTPLATKNVRIYIPSLQKFGHAEDCQVWSVQVPRAYVLLPMS